MAPFKINLVLRRTVLFCIFNCHGFLNNNLICFLYLCYLAKPGYLKADLILENCQNTLRSISDEEEGN